MAFIDQGNGKVIVTNFMESGTLAHMCDLYSQYSNPIYSFGGRQCYNLTSNSDYAEWNLGAGYASFRFSLGLYVVTPSSGTVTIFRILDGGTEQCSIYLDASSLIHVTGSADTFYMAPNVWHTLEGEVTISNTTGAWVLRLNGIEVLNDSGIDTQASGTAQATKVRIGATGNATMFHCRHFMLWTTTGAAPTGWMGDIKMDWIQPNAAGSSAQFTPSAGSNYACVDESPPSDSDYVEDNVVGHKDFYTAPDLSFATGDIYAVVRVSRARKTDAGSGSIRQNVKLSGTEGNGADIALATNDSYYRTAFPTRPTDSTSWTIADVNAIEFGSEIRA